MILLATLNHNLPDLTDNLVNQLKRDTSSIAKVSEILVLDNGSTERKAKSTTHSVDPNYFFGGGLNIILKYFLEKTDHKYLYILNNDLIFHGHWFISNSYEEAEWSDVGVYSPSIINASIEQCNWKQMWNWGTGGVRAVKWIDFQCALIRRDVAEIIQQYPDELIYGWGVDFYTGLICKDHGIDTCVSDTNVVCHLNSQTFKQNKINIGISEFCSNAERNMKHYFDNSKYKESYYDFRKYGETYFI